MKHWKNVILCVTMAAFLMFCVGTLAYADDEGSSTTVSTWEDLVNAVKNADEGDTIKLGDDIDATTSASLRVSEDITVDGQGYTLDGQNQYGFFVTKGGTLTLKNTVLANANRSTSRKASALYAYSGGGANLENCVIYNCADEYSAGNGAIYCSSYALNMTNCTVVDSSNGVTIGTNGGTLTGNIFVGNKGTDLIFKSTSSKAKDGGYNLIGTTANQPEAFKADTTTISSDLSSHSSWLNKEGELVAGTDSPAIDKIPADAYSVPETDVFGTARPVGTASDIGAVEYQPEDESNALESIAVTTAPKKTEYIEGQKFNKSGMVVTATYADGSTKKVRSYTYDLTGELTTDNTEVTITYEGKTCTQAITVTALGKIDSADKLREAIESAEGDITINLADDITLDENWAQKGTFLDATQNITINGNGHAIDGADTYAFLGGTKGKTITLENMTITNMYCKDDAAVVDGVSGSSIEMYNCIVKDNTGYHGIVLAYNCTKLVVDHCTFLDNVSTSTSNYTTLYNRATSGTVQNSIFVNNTSNVKNAGYVLADVKSYSNSNALEGDYNVISSDKYAVWKTGASNKVSEDYATYKSWMKDSGKLRYPTTGSKTNPAVDINPDENPTGILATDMNGKDRPQGKGSDAGAVETTARNAATPKITKDLTADTDSYTIGDVATMLDVEAEIDDDGTLSYEWYYIDYIDETTTATVLIDGANEKTYTPPTGSVGNRGYFAVVYNTNEKDSTINGKNGVIDKTNADTRRATAVYAITETHQVDVSAGDLKVTGITVTKAPDKTTYVEGQTFDKTGMEVALTYSNGVQYPVTGYAVDPSTALSTDDTKVTVSYDGFTTEQDIKVVSKAITGIEITKAPTKTDYDEGDPFDKTGMEVTATYNDGTTGILEDYTVTPAENLTKDMTEVTVSCEGENGTTVSATQAITVGINNDAQLRKAVEKAKAGDTITLTGNITLDAEQGAIEISKDVTINGNGCEVSGDNKSAFITLTGGTLTLKNIRITGMLNEDGGAVIDCYKKTASLTLENCIIAGNQGTTGAIDFAPTKGELKVRFSTIINNKAASEDSNIKGTIDLEDGVAGGINVGSKATTTISESILVGNTLYSKANPYDVNLDKKQGSGGNNMFGVVSGLTTTGSDKADKGYACYDTWMEDNGTLIKTDSNPVTLVTRDEDITKDMKGNDRNESTAVGALELVDKAYADAPEITSDLNESQDVEEGKTLVLAVTAEGNGTLTYRWYKDNEAIEGATDSTLTIEKAASSDTGAYYVVVTNSTKDDTATATSKTCTVNVTKKSNTSSIAKKVLLAKVTKVKKTSQVISWNKVAGADGYQIYKATKNGKYKLVKTTTKTSWKSTKLKKATVYKYYVKAYKKSTETTSAGSTDSNKTSTGKTSTGKTSTGKMSTIATSAKVYSVTKGGKYSNPKSVRVSKTKVTLKVDKTSKISAKVVKSGKKMKNYTSKLRYVSNNTGIAKVDKNGKITGVRKGTCSIYAYAQNGVYKKITVTVK